MATIKTGMNLSIVITPSGQLHLQENPAEAPSSAAEVKLRDAFEQSSAAGLLHLAKNEIEDELPVEFVFWRGFARAFFQRVCQIGEGSVQQWAALAPPAEEELNQFVTEAP